MFHRYSAHRIWNSRKRGIRRVHVGAKEIPHVIECHQDHDDAAQDVDRFDPGARPNGRGQRHVARDTVTTSTNRRSKATNEDTKTLDTDEEHERRQRLNAKPAKRAKTRNPTMQDPTECFFAGLAGFAFHPA